MTREVVPSDIGNGLLACGGDSDDACCYEGCVCGDCVTCEKVPVVMYHRPGCCNTRNEGEQQ